LINFPIWAQDFDKSILNQWVDSKVKIYDTWEYFELKDTIIVSILDHEPAPVDCGRVASASITIVIMEKGDTIRVIGMCNTSNKYKKGQQIKIVPSSKPLSHLMLPMKLRDNPKTKKAEQFQSYFDLNILKSTWGVLIEI
jgi:hypothetical protein